MRKVFVDSLYLVAHIYPRDTWHAAARKAARALVGNVLLVTTHEVLIEFLSGMADTGPYFRNRAVTTVRSIHANPRFQMLSLSEARYQRGLERYAARRDKSYSLVDCISMVAMEEEGIDEILTHDHHFEQERFTRLIV